MHYQVVAKERDEDVEPMPALWECYPNWTPGTDRSAAEDLAEGAARDGLEAAILQAPTVEMLERLVIKIVDQQETQFVPALRYIPGAGVAYVGGRVKYDVETTLCVLPELDPYEEGPNKYVLDKQRLDLELGAGGDVTRGNSHRYARVSLPRNMDVLRAWLRLQACIAHGQVGGPADGGCDQEASGWQAVS